MSGAGTGAVLDDTLLFDTAERLDRLIGVSYALGLPGRVELFRQMKRGRLLVMELSRDRVASIRLLKRQRKPVAVLLGDDDDQPSGPSGWVSLPRLLRWANRGLIHATGGDPASYGLAVGMAVDCGRLLLVETDSAHGPEWARALLSAKPPVPFVGLKPPGNAVHPVAQPTEGLH